MTVGIIHRAKSGTPCAARDSVDIRRNCPTLAGTYHAPFEFCCLHQPVLIKKMQAKNTTQKCGVFHFSKKKSRKEARKVKT